MDFSAPPYPPPLLSRDQIIELCEQGHIPLTISLELRGRYQHLTRQANKFFATSEGAKKSRFPAAKDASEGYYYVKGEKEYITLRRATRQPMDELEQAAWDAWRRTAALMQRVISDASKHLGMEDAPWEQVLDGSLSLPTSPDDSRTTFMRLFRYEPDTGISAMHKDLGLLTLCVGAGQGLQVWKKDSVDASSGEWLDANGPTLLVGKALHVLSGRRMNAGMHRVIGNPNGRSSAVFALRPSTRHEVDMALFGMPDRGVLRMQDLWVAIMNSAWNVNAQKDVREIQRSELRNKRLASTSSAHA